MRMGLLSAALCLLTACSGALPLSGTPYDSGGGVMAYHLAVEDLKASGAPYRAPSDCRSACTMLMDAPSVCWPARGRLGFHSAAINGSTLLVPVIDHYNRLIASHYPRDLRRWFLSDQGPGGQRSTAMVFITVADLNARFGAGLTLCNRRD